MRFILALAFLCWTIPVTAQIPVAAPVTAPVTAQTPVTVPAQNFHNCALVGTAKSASVQFLNTLKNRFTAPTAFDTVVTLDALFVGGDDTKRFQNTLSVKLTGYVKTVKPGGVESVNCGAKDPEFRDTHIELLRTQDDKALPVIVEVTPRWRAAMKMRGIDWSTTALKKTLTGHMVEFQGWMLFDKEHANASTNTHPGGAHNWRTTAWEPAHPVTSIEVIK